MLMVEVAGLMHRVLKLLANCINLRDVNAVSARFHWFSVLDSIILAKQSHTQTRQACTPKGVIEEKACTVEMKEEWKFVFKRAVKKGHN